MKKIHKIAGIVLSFAIITLIAGCGGGGSSSPTTPGSTPSAKSGTGVVSLNITDAPLVGEDVTEVNITVVGIEYHHDGNWTNADDFEGPQTFNLLELHNGKSLHLGDLRLPAGHYTEIRFKLDAPEKNGKHKSNHGCHITFKDGTSVPLFVPSGGQSGYKGKGAFDVTADGAKVEVTADFDVRKSIVVAGNSGKYLLKPVIRLVVNELSGEISGKVVDVAQYDADTDSLVVYAYEDDYPADEENENSEGVQFPNAVSSSEVNMSDGNFTLSFLGEGNYDLVTVQYSDSVFAGVVDVEKDVIVSTGAKTLVDVNTSD